MNPEQERQETPEVLTGEETAKLVAGLFDKVSIDMGCKLVDSNVVLTLAGLKPQTEFFIDAENKTLEEIQQELTSLNAALGKESGIEFRTVGTPYAAPKSKELTQMVSVDNLPSYENASRNTTLIDIPAFKKETGRDGFHRWWGELLASLEKKYESDKIPVEQIMTGIMKGYPDQAILDFTDWLKGGRKKTIIPSRIPRTGMYQEAQPNYFFSPEHANDPAIVKNIEQAGKILEDFYNSDWHKGVETKLEFHKAN